MSVRDNLAVDLVFIQNPLEWPNYPYLPLKRARDTNQPYDAAVLSPIGQYDYRLIHINMWALYDASAVAQALTEHFENAQAVVNAGWVVD